MAQAPPLLPLARDDESGSTPPRARLGGRGSGQGPGDGGGGGRLARVRRERRRERTRGPGVGGGVPGARRVKPLGLRRVGRGEMSGCAGHSALVLFVFMKLASKLDPSGQSRLRKGCGRRDEPPPPPPPRSPRPPPPWTPPLGDEKRGRLEFYPCRKSRPRLRRAPGPGPGGDGGRRRDAGGPFAGGGGWRRLGGRFRQFRGPRFFGFR